MNIEEAKKVLKEAGYYVDNLWQVEDVTGKFCGEAENLMLESVVDEYDAQNILDKVMQGEYIMEKIQDSIKDAVQDLYHERVGDWIRHNDLPAMSLDEILADESVKLTAEEREQGELLLRLFHSI